MKRKSFTIVELLVVVAIIAILVGVLVPALKIAREKTKTKETQTLAGIIVTDVRSQVEKKGTFDYVYSETVYHLKLMGDKRIFKAENNRSTFLLSTNGFYLCLLKS